MPRVRIFALVFGVICLNALGNLSLAWGMKHVGESVNLNPLSFFRAMLDPAVATGILLLILWLLSRMTLLSWADLSFVLPLTSLGYVLAAVFGKVFLNETVTGAPLARHRPNLCGNDDRRYDRQQDFGYAAIRNSNEVASAFHHRVCDSVRGPAAEL